MAHALHLLLTCCATLGKVPNFPETRLENRKPQGFGGETREGEGGCRIPKGKLPGKEGSLHVSMCLTVATFQAWPQCHCVEGDPQCKKEKHIEIGTRVCRSEALRVYASQVLFKCLQDQDRWMIKGRNGEAALGVENSPQRSEGRGRAQPQRGAVLLLIWLVIITRPCENALLLPNLQMRSLRLRAVKSLNSE